MRTYWDEFIIKYGSRFPYVSMANTLEAFWHFCNAFEDKNSAAVCREIMERNPE